MSGELKRSGFPVLNVPRILYGNVRPALTHAAASRAASSFQYRFRFQPMPHLPHGWDAGMLFEETQKILFCSDLFHQVGKVEPIIESDAVLERSRAAMIDYQGGPLMDYVPYTHNTKLLLSELADLKPETLAIMHGSSFKGNGERLLQELGPVFKEVFGGGQK